jgi:hypothetical protein
MRLRLLLVVSIVLAFGVAVSGALAGEGSPPSPRKLCTKGHWQQQGFKSESKCVNFLQSVQQDCKSVEGKFGADNQNGTVAGAKVLWTCNGDGVTDDFADNVLFPACFILGNTASWSLNGTQGVSAMTCFRT